MMKSKNWRWVAGLLMMLAGGLPATAADKVTVAIGQKGLWDTLVTLQGIEHGFFEKENLDVEVTWTRGMGLKACEAACQFVLKNTVTRTIVDPFCGHGTVLAVANELGIPADDVKVLEGDTDNTPYGLGTYASRSTPVGGAATAMISRTLAEKAKKIFNILGDRVETVTPYLADGVLTATKSGTRVAWLTKAKAFGRFATAGFKKRDIFAEGAA